MGCSQSSRGRLWPVKVTQAAQKYVQDEWSAGTRQARGAPWPVRLLDAVAPLRRIPAQLVGMGMRPEHVRTPDVYG